MGTMKNQEQVNESLKLFVVLSRAARAVNDRIAEDIHSYGLNPTEFAVLELLYHKGSQPIQVIGKKVLIASSSITYVVDKLESKGYVQRIASSEDRRVILADLTPAGSDLMDVVFPRHAQSIHSVLDGLDFEEKHLLIQQLKKLGLHAQEMQHK